MPAQIVLCWRWRASWLRSPWEQRQARTMTLSGARMHAADAPVQLSLPGCGVAPYIPIARRAERHGPVRQAAMQTPEDGLVASYLHRLASRGPAAKSVRAYRYQL